jgi:hypothetical protein
VAVTTVVPLPPFTDQQAVSIAFSYGRVTCLWGSGEELMKAAPTVRHKTQFV